MMLMLFGQAIKPTQALSWLDAHLAGSPRLATDSNVVPSHSKIEEMLAASNIYKCMIDLIDNLFLHIRPGYIYTYIHVLKICPFEQPRRQPEIYIKKTCLRGFCNGRSDRFDMSTFPRETQHLGCSRSLCLQWHHPRWKLLRVNQQNCIVCCGFALNLIWYFFLETNQSMNTNPIQPMFTVLCMSPKWESILNWVFWTGFSWIGQSTHVKQQSNHWLLNM